MIRLGTRGSALALAQARLVAAALGAETALVPITTTGDRDRARTDKEKWVKELEQALLDGEIDLAVHSAKDVPSDLPEGLELVGAPPRADARDALCGELRGRVATSSLRRAAQLRAAHPEVEVVEIRGNVDTRLGKLAGGEVDGLVLAAAGLIRLGRADAIASWLDDMVPAPGQGVIALEARVGDADAAAAARRVTDASAWTALRCERAVVRALGAGCHTPVGAHAVLEGDGLVVETFAGLPDGSAWVRDRFTGTDPETLGVDAAARMLSAGAGELLRAAEEAAA